MRDLDAFAAMLDLDVDGVGICYACLSFVSFPLHAGDEREAKRATRQMTPFIWDEGLAEPALASVRAARDAGVAEADEALAELERSGGRSAVARAIVLRLAADLAGRMHAELRLLEAARDRLDAAPPEWN